MYRKRKPFDELSYRHKKRIVVEEIRNSLNKETVDIDSENSVDGSVVINNNDGCHSSSTSILNFENEVLTESNATNSSIIQNENCSESYTPSSPNVNLLENYKTFLRQWVWKHNVSKVAMNDLLGFLKKCDDNNLKQLPTDARTLMQTPRQVMAINDMCDGKYVHFGLEYGLTCCIQNHYAVVPKKVKVNFNIDGLPLTKSSSSQFWPILACPVEDFYLDPFPVGIFHGSKKPNNAVKFLEPFVTEAKRIVQSGGILVKGTAVEVVLNCFICDAPAKAFISGTKNHNGYFGCSKCIIEGDYCENRIVFLERDCLPRTDSSFANRQQPEHHLEKSALEILSVGMVSQLPLDYMHLVCLGVVKRLLQFWVKGKMDVRLKSADICGISAALLSFNKYTPKEFARKARPLEEVDRWKATEFRQFLLYTGPSVLKGKLGNKFYKHFLCLHISLRILTDKHYCLLLNDYARQLLEYFVKKYAELYGTQYVTYNVHNLLHLCDEVKLHGALDNYSAFKYENFLYKLKNKLKVSGKPLEQISNRIQEGVFSSKTVHKTFPIGISKNNEVYGVEYQKFTLTLKNSDKWCITNMEKICSIEKIDIINKKFTVRDYDFEQLFVKPLDSKILHMYELKTDGNVRNYEICFESIYRKCFVFEYNNKIMCYSLAHS